MQFSCGALRQWRCCWIVLLVWPTPVCVGPWQRLALHCGIELPGCMAVLSDFCVSYLGTLRGSLRSFDWLGGFAGRVFGLLLRSACVPPAGAASAWWRQRHGAAPGPTTGCTVGPRGAGVLVALWVCVLSAHAKAWLTTGECDWPHFVFVLFVIPAVSLSVSMELRSVPVMLAIVNAGAWKPPGRCFIDAAGDARAAHGGHGQMLQCCCEPCFGSLLSRCRGSLFFVMATVIETLLEWQSS